MAELPLVVSANGGEVGTLFGRPRAGQLLGAVEAVSERAAIMRLQVFNKTRRS